MSRATTARKAAAPEASDPRAVALSAEGVRFEVEHLMTGEASFEAVRDGFDGEPESLAAEPVPNGPGVPEAVDRLVRGAAEVLAARKAAAS